MTVSSTTTPNIQYNGNGVTTAFSTGFVFSSQADLKVILTSSAGVDTTLVLTSHYTVTGGAGATGTVTLLTAPASGEVLTIVRNTTKTQTTDYVENDSFPAESHEAALDKLTLISQELSENLSRAFTASETSGVSNLMIPAQASEFVRWNSAATGLETVALGDIDSFAIASQGILAYSGSNDLESRTITGTSNEVSVTNGDGTAGNPTISLPSSLTFTGKTILNGTYTTPTLTTPTVSSPVITGSIKDANSNELLTFSSTASAVNEFTITNSATGVAPSIAVTGGDTNIDMTVSAKGTGAVNVSTGILGVNGTSSSSSKLRLYEQTTNGTNYVDLVPTSSITSNRTITLPDGDINLASVYLDSYLSANLTPTTSLATLTINTVVYDSHSYFNTGTSRYTPLIAGKYHVMVIGAVGKGVLASSVIIGIRKNGSAVLSGRYGDAASISADASVHVATIVDMNGSTDYIDLSMQTTAGSGTIYGTSTIGTRLLITKLN